MPLNHICGIRRGFPRLSPWQGQVAYVLLTRAPVADRSASTPSLPLDLHVLSLSLAFILSQDQTLRCCYILLISFYFFVFELSYTQGVCYKNLFQILTETSFFITRLVLLCLVYCKYFNVLPSQNSFRFRVAIDTPFPFCECKVTTTFLITQIFYKYFFIYFLRFYQNTP